MIVVAVIVTAIVFASLAYALFAGVVADVRRLRRRNARRRRVAVLESGLQRPRLGERQTAADGLWWPHRTTTPEA